MDKFKDDIKASPDLRIFFERLLELRAQVKIYADRNNMAAFQEIYQTLNSIIKEAQ